jgi:hypothetical protein
MNTAFIKWLVVISAVCWPLGAFCQDRLDFDPIFQDNMVLQRSPATMIYGIGPPKKKITLSYRLANGETPGKWSTKVQPDGKWFLAVNCSALASPGTLSLHQTFGPTIERHNVALGEVWLWAGWEKQGVSLKTDEITRCEGVRFSRLQGGQLAPWGGWPVTPEEFADFPSLTLRMAYLLEEGKGISNASDDNAGHHIGMVHVTAKELEAALKPGWQPAAGNPQIEVSKYWDSWLDKSTRNLENDRQRRLKENQRVGVVEEIVPVIDYDIPSVFPYEAFSPQAPPAAWFTFKGAIWTRPKP